MKNTIHNPVTVSILLVLFVFITHVEFANAESALERSSQSELIPRIGRCGDGIKTDTELCDGSIREVTCSSFALGKGTISCDSDCNGFDASACQLEPTVCGNNRIDQGVSRGQYIELCDGKSLGNFSCTTFGFDGGTLTCDSDCLGFDTRGCRNDVCGDDVAGPSETCDGTDFKGKSCSDYGYHYGTLSCNDCGIDTARCTNFLWVTNFTTLRTYTYTPLTINKNLLLRNQIPVSQPTLSGLTSIYDRTFKQENTLDTSSFTIALSPVLNPQIFTINLPDSVINELYPVFQGVLSRYAGSAEQPSRMEVMAIPNIAGNALVAAITTESNTTLETSLIIPLQETPLLTAPDIYILNGQSAAPNLIIPTNNNLISSIYFSSYQEQPYIILDITASNQITAKQLSADLNIQTINRNGVIVHSAAVADNSTPLYVLSKNCTDCHSGGFVSKFNMNLTEDPPLTLRTNLSPTAAKSLALNSTRSLSVAGTTSHTTAGAGVAPALLSGAASNTDDNPVAGAWVLMHDLAGPVPVLVAITMPDPAGAYFAMIPGGKFPVSVEHDSYLTTTIQSIVLPSGGSVEQNFKLFKNPAVSEAAQAQQSVVSPSSTSQSAEAKSLGTDTSKDICPPTPPGLTGAQPAQGQFTNQQNIGLSWSPATDGQAVVGYALLINTNANSSPAETITHPSLPASIALGSTENGYYLHVKAKDASGNWNATTNFGPWYYDITPPGPPAIGPAPAKIEASTFEIGGTRDNNTSIWLNGAQVVPASGQTTWAYTLTALTEGNNTFSFTARDSAGNQSGVTAFSIIRVLDNDGDGFTEIGGDCNDADGQIYPSAPEICDTRDNDCNGSTVDGSAEPWFGQTTSCGAGICSSTGTWQCSNGVKTNTCTPGAPQAEICGNGIDEDCNGNDLGCDTVDNDGDGFTEIGGDCNDADGLIHPSAPEICDNRDNDCNGSTVDGSAEPWFGQSTSCGVGICSSTGTWQCVNGVKTNTCAPGTPQAEICGNGIDEDCNGSDLNCQDVDNDGDGFSVFAGDCNDNNASITPLTIQPGDVNADGLVDLDDAILVGKYLVGKNNLFICPGADVNNDKQIGVAELLYILR